MQIKLLTADRYADAEIDDRLIDLYAGDDVLKQAEFISRQLQPYIFAMLQLKSPQTQQRDA